jgi:cupin 2 domain-containing protein
MPSNLFASTAPTDGEVIDTLVETRSVKIERIVSSGQATPPGEWYDQDRDEWVALLSGAATIRFEDPDELISLTPGDWQRVAAHRRHRVETTAVDRESVWIAVHFQT